jgi:hypothetical protein
MQRTDSLSYRMPVRAALLKALWFAPIGLSPLFKGHLLGALAFVALAVFAGFLICRFLLATVVHTRGLTLDGLRHVDWPEVTDATLADGSLKLGLKNGSRAELQAAIVSDPTFLAKIRGWIPDHHPIRRAIAD